MKPRCVRACDTVIHCAQTGFRTVRKKFERQLHETRRLGTNDVAKLGRVGNVAIDRLGAEQLRMIEKVECFDTKSGAEILSEGDGLLYAHVEVVHPRTGKGLQFAWRYR